MLELVLRIALALVLVAAATAKLARPRESLRGLGELGFAAGPMRAFALALAVGAELGLAALLALGSDAAAHGAAALMALYALVMVSALLRGRAGRPCGCFGARSRIGWPAVGRNLALALAFALVPLVPDGPVSSEGWLALGLGVSLGATAALSVVVLALAREVGLMRLRLGPSSALELAHEGPELGGRSAALAERLAPGPGAELGLAVFTSAGCHVCRELEPAVETIASEPAVEVATVEEQAEAGLWESLGIPGAPYAVAIGPDGTVLAKGTFNNLAQLEAVLATAERRRTHAVEDGDG